MKSSKIEINVQLDENKNPEKIQWEASDNPLPGVQECSSFMLSLWDGESKDNLQIHLWTTKMTIEEMNHFYFRSMMMMADSFQRSTQNAQEAQAMRDFVKGFGERTKVLNNKA